MPRFKKIFLVIIISLLLLIENHSLVFAQSANQTSNAQSDQAGSLGVAHMMSVKDKNVKDGSLLSTSGQGVVLSTTPYDAQIAGVVSRDAGIIISSNEGSNAVPVISNGTVYVLVSSQQGKIKKGEMITSSTIPGVAVKATKSGYVLGYALEDYSDSDPKKVGKIAVDLSLHYFNSRSTLAGTLTDILKVAVLPTKDSPNAIFKYVVAALVVLGSFFLGFVTFGRTASKGVEALGRNPAASTTIHLGIIFNVIIVIMIILAGLVVAFLILRL
jgi:F0F1-type ATP synthase membrane subunit c/vacuolar-type H+-ATPase subunit K